MAHVFYFLMHSHRSCAVLVFSGVPGAPFSRFQVSQVRRSSRFQVPRCAVPDVFRCPGAPFITFSGVPGAARRPYSIFQVPCWGLKILLSGIGSHTSAPRLEVQNFNPILFPARPLKLTFLTIHGSSGADVAGDHVVEVNENRPWGNESTFLHWSESDRCRWCFHFAGAHLSVVLIHFR